jgi:hypothetical protein
MTSHRTRQLTSYPLVLAGVFATVLAATSVIMAQPLRATEATKSGWWVKVQKSKQESPTITFSIGSNNHTVQFWHTWNSGDPLEFDVPDQFRNINPLYIKAQSSGGRNSWFCMMYRDAGVKHFDFDDDEDHEEQQGNRDDECNFSN